jgi:hypothetical protein
MKKMGKKGVIMSNLLMLGLFYLIYFTMIPVVKYATEMIGNTSPLDTYYDAIPTGTTQMMDLILYAIIPIGALIFTLMSSRPQEQYVG